MAETPQQRRRRLQALRQQAAPATKRQPRRCYFDREKACACPRRVKYPGFEATAKRCERFRAKAGG